MFFKNAEWIYNEEGRAPLDDRHGSPAVYFRKEFSACKRIEKAKLYATSLGVFKAYINGSQVDNDYLSPGWTDYRKRIPYMEFDVTDLLQRENAVGIVAADGWAIGYIGYEVTRQNYNDRIELFASLVVTYTDGSEEYIETDSSWKTSYGEITGADLLMGESIDARKSLGAFSVFGYDDSAWSAVAVTSGVAQAQKCYFLDKAIAPKTTVMHIITPKYLFRDPQGRSIYDFEQNMVGVAKIVIKAKRGSVLTVRFGEMLESDGSVYRRNLRRAEATDSYIASGCGTEVFRPLFTFHGFRYMELTAVGEIEIISIAGEVMYSQLSATAGFSCDDPVINRLYQNIVWGQRSNFLNVPTDCPQRDERLGWTGDSQVFCGTAMFNMDCRAFYKKHLADIRDAQCGNGGITGVAPVIPHPDHAVLQGRVGAAGWADVITILPYEYFRMYGDISVISENLWAMKRYNRYILDNSDHYIRRCYKEYGDWLSVGEETDKTLIATAFFAYSTLLIAEMCELIGDSDAAYYRELYGKIKRAFRKEFLVSPVLRSDTQTSYLLAYKAQIMTAAEIKDRLLRTIYRNDRHLSTGFLGVKYLLPVLCELGETALAYELFTKRSYPSWCYSVVRSCLRTISTVRVRISRRVQEKWNLSARSTEEDILCSICTARTACL